MTTKTKRATLTNRQTHVLLALLQSRAKNGVTISDLFRYEKYRSKLDYPSHYWPDTENEARKAVRNSLYQLKARGFVSIEKRPRSEGFLFWVRNPAQARKFL